jgi:hypothetical protein
MNHTLILLSENSQDQEFLNHVALSTGFPLKICLDADEALEVVIESPGAILFVDVTTPEMMLRFESIFSEILSTPGSALAPHRVHLIAPPGVTESDHYFETSLYSHFIPRQFGSIADSGLHYGKLLKMIVTNDFSQLGTIRLVELHHSSEKQKAIGILADFLRDLDFVERAHPIIITAVDELLMNAIYDAPTNPQGEQTHQNTPRNAPMELDPEQTIELSLSAHGDYVAFTVIDRFGTLDKPKLLKHLFASRTTGNTLVDPTRTGAGVGLATTFMTGGSLLFVHEPGVRTVVTVFFRHSKNFREFKDQFRFISVHETRRPRLTAVPL